MSASTGSNHNQIACSDIPLTIGVEFHRFKEKAFTQTTLVHGGSGQISTQSKVAAARQTVGTTTRFISAYSKRSSGGGRKPAHPDVVEWLLRTVQEHADVGDALSLNRLTNMIMRVKKFRTSSHSLAPLLDRSQKRFPKNLKQFIIRALERARWVIRANTVCSEIPLNWDQLAIENVEALCQLAIDFDAQAIIAADEVCKI